MEEPDGGDKKQSAYIICLVGFDSNSHTEQNFFDERRASLHGIKTTPQPSNENENLQISKILPHLIPEAEVYDYRRGVLYTTGRDGREWAVESDKGSDTGKESAILADTSTESIQLQAAELLSVLRKQFCKSDQPWKRILLAGYGLWAVVVKEAIITANTNPTYYRLSLQISNLVFFGTPHWCEDPEKWGGLILTLLGVSGRLKSVGRVPKSLSKLVTAISLLSARFYNFTAKYSISSVIGHKDILGEETAHTEENDPVEPSENLESGYTLGNGTDKKFIRPNRSSWDLLLYNDTLSDLQWIRDLFAPLSILNCHKPLTSEALPGSSGFSSGVGVVNSGYMERLYLQILQMLSPSRLSIYESSMSDIEIDSGIPFAEIYPDRANDSPADVSELQQTSLDPKSYSAGSCIQIIGGHGHGKLRMLSHICQKFRQHTQRIILECVLEPADNTKETFYGVSTTAYGVLVSFVRQLLSQKPSWFRSVANLVQEYFDLGTWSEANFWAIFWLLVDSEPASYLIAIRSFGALPDDTQKLLLALRTAFTDRGIDNIYILTNSSPVESMQNSCSKQHDIKNLASYGSGPRAEFLRTRIERIIKETSRLKFLGWEENKGIQDQLLEKIISSSESLNDIDLSLEFLRSRKFGLTNVQSMKETLRMWPESREKLYKKKAEELGLMNKDVRTWCRSALLWVLHSCRPLRVKELAVALAVTTKDTEYQVLANRVSRNIQSDLYRHLGLFLRVEAGEVHPFSSKAELSSIIEILEKFKDSTVEGFTLDLGTHGHLAAICVQYIKMALLHADTAEQWNECISLASCAWEYDQEGSDQNEDLEFLDYALRFWPHHYAQAIAEESESSKARLNQIVSEFLHDTSLRSRWFHLYLIATSDSNGGKPSGKLSTKCLKELIFQSSFSDVLSHFGFSSMVSPEPGASSIATLENYDAQKIKIIRGAFVRMAEFSNTFAPEFAHACALHSDPISFKGILVPQGPTLMVSAFQVAAQSGRLEVVESFAESAKTIGPNKRKRTAIHSAVIGGNLRVLDYILEDDPSEKDSPDDVGETPLILAAKLQKKEILSRLIEENVEINAQDNNKRTALHFAAYRGPSIVEQFWETSPMILPDCDLESPFHLAARTGSTSTIQKLLDIVQDYEESLKLRNKAKQTLFDVAAAHGYVEIIKLLKSRPGLGYFLNDEKNSSSEGLAAGLATENGHLPALEAIVKDWSRCGQILLHKACENGQLLVAKYILSKDLKDTDLETEQKLMRASQHGYLEIARLLIKRANVNAKDEGGKTALHYAAENGYVNVVQLLIEHGANIEEQDALSLRPVQLAVKEGKYDVAAVLLRRGADADMEAPGGKSLLHLGVRHSDIISLILRYRTKLINRTDSEERTPLALASIGGYTDTVQVLLEAGADRNLSDDDDCIPLYYAITNKHTDIVDKLLDTTPLRNMKALLQAIRYTKIFKTILPAITGSLSAVGPPEIEELMEDMEKEDYFGGHVLHQAARRYPDVLECTLQEREGWWKQFLNRKNKEGSTPVFLAAYGGVAQNVELLIKTGADIHEAREDGWSPLHAGADSLEVTKLLLAENPNIDQKDQDGLVPISYAAVWNKAAVVDALLDKGANVNILDAKERTPLHYAGSLRDRAALERLISKTEDLNKVDNTGMSYLHKAISTDNEDMVELLCGRGVDIERCNQDGLSYLEAAVTSPKSLEILLDFTKEKQIWSPETKEKALKKACEAQNDDSVELLVVLNEQLRETPLFENYVPTNEKGDFGMRLLSHETYDPFKPWGVDNLTGFQRAFTSRKAIMQSFIDGCLQKGPDVSLGVWDGFEELRTAIEIQSPEMWHRFQRFREKAMTSTDPDGWSLNDFLHQAGKEWVSALGEQPPIWPIKVNNTDPTSRLPSTFLVPPNWSKSYKLRSEPEPHIQRKPRFSINRERRRIRLKGTSPNEPYTNIRSDLPFPPRGGACDYFEVRIIKMEFYRVRKSWFGFRRVYEEAPRTPVDESPVIGWKEGSDDQAETSEEDSENSEDESAVYPDGEKEAVVLGIGFCGEFSYLQNSPPGDRLWSIGCRSDNGYVYSNSQGGSDEEKICDGFREGDTIGCGLDVEEGKFIFILNGKLIKTVKCDLAFRKFYPVITYRGIKGARIEYKFENRNTLGSTVDSESETKNPNRRGSWSPNRLRYSYDRRDYR
ncbi:hypothetical protein TWF481_009208 [Arthrobotrys musiformis]|uniref:B30.2/SPRY domain-containing protein n=1 Tax=Arthrobotrys musiformis TaxID=47236 RepID=A0AAV9W330_9PEZI